MQQHTLNVLVKDHPGVLHRTVSLLRRRAINIASLAVGRSERADESRMTVVVDAADARQVVRQLDTLVEVLAVHDVTDALAVRRETLLVRVRARGDELAAVVTLALDDGVHVLDVGNDAAILELTDTPERVDAFIALLRPVGIVELRRTGTLVMTRGGTDVALADSAGVDDPGAELYPLQAERSAGDDVL